MLYFVCSSRFPKNLISAQKILEAVFPHKNNIKRSTFMLRGVLAKFYDGALLQQITIIGVFLKHP